MPIVSTRIDDSTKLEADEIANRIGMPLSTAINVFVKRFVAEQGFPFEVVATESKRKPFINIGKLDAAVNRAVVNSNSEVLSHQITYLDKKTDKLDTFLSGKGK